MSSSINNVASQLEVYFGTSDLLEILGIKNKEAYMNAPSDPFTARQSYLRSVLRHHPDANCVSANKAEQYQEYVLRSKKMVILRDIYEFLSSENEEVKVQRNNYFEKGEHPQLLSLEILHDAAKCKKRFGVPDFERVADELKEIFAIQMRRIKELQEQEALLSKP
ncbi:hypothetical protein Ocin01_05217 [Orchesella cincta]|uniref:J domain-containing protein n=1 Tax=Orchesella cincta TaxID=48709 RepID=A0A1D2N884_ORCCI|nr:hypothetical protein Ocin01_05217 [Orchesella cincta]